MNIMKKTALITGATGGIGGAFAKALEEQGYELILPVRNIAKLSQLSGNFFAKQIDLESLDSFISFFNEIKSVRRHIDLVVLSAGRFAWDNEFETQEIAIEELDKANFQTKKVAVASLREVFGDTLNQTTIIIISSHAAHFDENHPFRAGEEGYVRSMIKVSEFAKRLDKENLFKKVILEEPGRVGTESAKSSFNAQTIGEDLNWEQEMSPETYVQNVLSNIA